MYKAKAKNRSFQDLPFILHDMRELILDVCMTLTKEFLKRGEDLGEEKEKERRREEESLINYVLCHPK